MDFEEVLYKAQKIQKKKTKEPSKCYRTSFSPPRKEEKTKGLSSNIQKFLARKEEEERRRRLEEARKKEELLALRNQDNKAKKRVQVMLKRTKSANKSVLVDAIDTVNTADTINGPQQCDEDDYGYVSQEASTLYRQMMEKYSAVPVEEKKSYKPNNRATAKDLINTKDRVKQALLRQEEEENMPHKRKRKHKDDEEGHENTDDHGGQEASEQREKVSEKPKPKRPAMPPPMDFNSLLKIAEKKQFEPVVIEKKEVKPVEKEPERLMTKKEKAEYERLKEREKRKSEALKSSTKPKSDDVDVRDPDRRRDREKLEFERERREDSDRSRSKESNIRSKHSSSQPSRSRSRSRSPIRDRVGKIKQTHSSSNSPACSSSVTSKEDLRRNASVESKQSSIVSKIPKIPKLNGMDKKFAEKSTDKGRSRDGEREREREKQLERDREKERDRLERERERERERQKQKEREKREKEKEMLRERLRELDREDKEKEEQRAREKAKERERYEKEKLAERKEKEAKENALKRPITTSDKVKLSDGKKTSKYNKLDLFGERESISPERPKISTKISKPQEPLKKNSKPERIKIVEDGTRDLFDNPVTLPRKHNPGSRDKHMPKPISSKTDEKAKPSSSSASSSVSSSGKLNSAVRSGLDKESSRSSSTSANRKDLDEEKFMSDKKMNAQGVPTRESKLGESGFKKPFPHQSTSASRQPLSKDNKPRQFPPRDLQPKQFPPRDLQPKQFPPRDLQPKQFPPRDLQPKQFPPKDLQRKQFPPRDLKPKQFPPSDVRRNALAKKRYEYERSDSDDSDEDEDEDEYDPDLDDFIDDGGVDDQEDYSEYIKKIFNYDKSKYIDEDSDIEESSFAQQMREECRSARLGLLEDLEDIAIEQQEKRRKAIMKMKRGKR